MQDLLRLQSKQAKLSRWNFLYPTTEAKQADLKVTFDGIPLPQYGHYNVHQRCL